MFMTRIYILIFSIFLPLQDPVLPVDLKGESFCALLGTGCRYYKYLKTILCAILIEPKPPK